LIKELFLKNPLLRRVEEGYSSDNQEDLWECADIKECPLVEYSYILGLLNKQLTEAKGILENIKRWDIPLSRNFDLVELSLRRCARSFFPLKGIIINTSFSLVKILSPIQEDVHSNGPGNHPWGAIEVNIRPHGKVPLGKESRLSSLLL